LDQDIQEYLYIFLNNLCLSPNFLFAYTARQDKFHNFTKFNTKLMPKKKPAR